MTPSELADEIDGVITHLRSRIEGTGKEQYDQGDTQKIETFDDAEVLINAIEEIDDAIVYLAHLRVRLARAAKLFGRTI
ncbi:hypothetical protein UFOVP1264_45 [uncultured Caudovirales phage]|uniref:Uncharacterized protein n=1 Tax=uncultured Caudovirales phage TaxID=2100421 RepID=A0A6J5RAK3_9CAUD|nr:hypothetical protein UFOVP1264_45 [uncultured Caudovirales phage]